MRILWPVLLAAATLASCAHDRKEDALSMNDETVRKDLETLRGKRIYFGHQSVGFDIMKGVREYASADSGPGIRFVTLDSQTSERGAFFADSRIGRNNHPDEKCAAFRSHVERLEADTLDLAAMKFCYADIEPGTEVAKVFDDYARTIDSLKNAFPRTVFVLVTVPYTRRTSSWKLFIKKIIGRSDKSEAANYQRNRFNAMLLERYAGEPIFDLAKVESTYPGGKRESFEYEGRTVYSLIGAYTSDGGHLNETGRRLAAREMIRVFADAVRSSHR